MITRSRTLTFVLATSLMATGLMAASPGPASASAHRRVSHDTATSTVNPFDPAKFNAKANLAHCARSDGYWNWYYCNDPAVVGCKVFSNGTCGEYGVDIDLPAGTPIYAPQAGTISRNGPCAPPDYSCWVPGRVLLSPDSGDPYPGVMGFGHVNFQVGPGHVTAGQLIATVADQSTLGTGWSDHVEFMYSPSGSIATEGAFTGGCNAPAYPCGEAPSNANSPWSVLVALEGKGSSTVATALLPGSSAGYALSNDGNITAFGGAPPATPSATWNFDIARRIVVLPNGTGGYVLDGWGGLHPFSIGANPQPPATSGGPYWQGWDIARGVALLPDGTGGYVLDGWGAVHPFAIGSNPKPPATASGPYWKGWDIARGVALLPDGTGGYVLDGYGGVHPFAIGSNPKPPAVTETGYWNGWDIARDIVLDFTGSSGYTLDGYGGVHAFAAAGTPMPPSVTSPDYHTADTARGLALYQVRSAGNEAGGAVSNIPAGVAGEYVTTNTTTPHRFFAPAPTRDVAALPGVSGAGFVLDGGGDIRAFGGAPDAHPTATWNWDIARRIVVLPNGTGGYVLDGWGALHPFAIGSNPAPPATSSGPYWGGHDIARGVVLLPDATGGYVLDGYGEVLPFAVGANPLPPATNGGPFWSGWDIARGLVILPNATGGYVLDGWGGIHPFAIGANPVPAAATGNAYWNGWDIARDIELLPKSLGGQVLDGFGVLYPFAIGANPKPNKPTIGGNYPGWDVATGAAVGGRKAPVTFATVDSHGGVHKGS